MNDLDLHSCTAEKSVERRSSSLIDLLARDGAEIHSYVLKPCLPSPVCLKADAVCQTPAGQNQYRGV